MDPSIIGQAVDVLARARAPLPLTELHARLRRRGHGARCGPAALREALERRPPCFIVFDPPRPAWLEGLLVEPGSPYRAALATMGLSTEPHVLLRPDACTDASMVPLRDDATLAPVWATLTRLWDAAAGDAELRDAVAAAFLAAAGMQTSLTPHTGPRDARGPVAPRAAPGPS